MLEPIKGIKGVDVKSQRVAMQLANFNKNMYDIFLGDVFKEDTSHYSYDLVYEFLMEQGHDFKLSESDKKKLWQLTKRVFNKRNANKVKINKQKTIDFLVSSREITRKIKSGELFVHPDYHQAIVNKPDLSDQEIEDIANDMSFYKKERIKMYKSYLVRAFLFNQWQAGYDLNIINEEDGKPLKRFELGV